MKLDYCHLGDCRDVMRQLIADGVRVQTIVTSPPYFGLRDYGVAGQIGLEATMQEYIANMVEVFEVARELLADDGTLWLNLGDSYASSGRGGNPTEATSGLQGGQASQRASMSRAQKPPLNLKPKDLMGIPWRVSFALQESGWYLRQDIIWAKPNPMPESVKDRCTKAHEYIFLMSKSPRYYFDAEAIAEDVSQSTIERLAQPTLAQQAGSERVPGKTNGTMKAVPPSWNGSNFDHGKTGEMKHTRGHKQRKEFNQSQGGGGSSFVGHSGYFKADGTPICGGKRNKRSVWEVTTQPFKEAHFATFPPALIEPCILAGSKPGDIVFDPFMGSGTVGQVAQQLGRRWLGAELNPEYLTMQSVRTRQSGLVLEAKT